jgi:hypothetical protein
MMCRGEHTVMLEQQTEPDLAAWLEKTEIICSACARRFIRDADSQYIVIGGAYYRKGSAVYAKVGPVGAFHG